MNACELGGCTSGILLPEFGATPKLADLPVVIHTVTCLCWQQISILLWGVVWVMYGLFLDILHEYCFLVVKPSKIVFFK